MPPPTQEPTDLRESPPLMFHNRGPPNVVQASTMALNRSVYSAASHGQIVIESNSGGGSSSQSRDWTNVYVEEMAPYAADGGDVMMAPAASNNAGQFMDHHHHHHQPHVHQQQHHHHLPHLQDPLGDTQPEMCSRRQQQLYEEQQQQQQMRMKFNRQRHSLWVDSGPAVMTMNQSDLRRYSDTRLMVGGGEQHQQPQQQQHEPHIFNVATAAALPPIGGHCGGATSQSNNNNNGGGHHGVDSTAIEMGDGESPQITDILFEGAEGSFDPLELNIQELLELDIRTSGRGDQQQQQQLSVGMGMMMMSPGTELRTSQLSVNSDPQKYFKCDGQRKLGGVVDISGGGGIGGGSGVAVASEERHNLLAPQSLPNLSASSENLLQQGGAGAGAGTKGHHQF